MGKLAIVCFVFELSNHTYGSTRKPVVLMCVPGIGTLTRGTNAGRNFDLDFLHLRTLHMVTRMRPYLLCIIKCLTLTGLYAYVTGRADCFREGSCKYRLHD